MQFGIFLEFQYLKRVKNLRESGLVKICISTLRVQFLVLVCLQIVDAILTLYCSGVPIYEERKDLNESESEDIYCYIEGTF